MQKSIFILLLQICTSVLPFSFPGCYFYEGFGCGNSGGGCSGGCVGGCGGECENGCRGGGGCGFGCGCVWPVKNECDGEWGPWSEWSECNKEDKKQRIRFCNGNCCKGDRTEVGDCEKKKKEITWDLCSFSFTRFGCAQNGCGGGGGCGFGCGCGWPVKNECDGEWGPWSEWTDCDKADKKRRIRFCKDICCKGDAVEETDCEKKKITWDPCYFGWIAGLSCANN